MKVLYIYGAGDEGKKVADLALRLGKYDRICFIDDNPNGKGFLGMTVLTFDKALSITDVNSEFIVAVGEPVIRKILYQKIAEKKLNIATLTYPEFFKSIGVNICRGTIVHCGALIQHEVEIGENCMINMHSTIGHNVVVGENSVVSTGTIIGGNTIIGEDTYIGSGAVIRDGINIGNHCIIGMGAVVTKNVEDNMVVVGNPAKVLRENTSGSVFNKNS